MTVLSSGTRRLLLAAACAALLAGTGAPAPVQAQSAPHSFRVLSLGATPLQVSTGPRETVEIRLPAGGTLIVAPGTSLSVGTGTSGAPEVSLSSGFVRVASGPAGEVTVRTPRGLVRVVRGAAILDLTEATLRANLLYGEGVQVSVEGQERLIYRPGFEVVATASGLSSPRRMTPAEVAADLLRLSVGLTERTLPTGQTGRAGTQGAGVGAGSGGQTAPAPGAPGLALDLPRDVAGGSGGGNSPGGGGGNVPPSFDLAGSVGIGRPSVGTPTLSQNEADRPSSGNDVAGFFHRQNFDDRNPILPTEQIDRYVFREAVWLGPSANHLSASQALTRLIPAGIGGVGHVAGGNLQDHRARGLAYFDAVVSDGLASAFTSGGTRITSAREEGLVRFPLLPIGVFSNINTIINSTRSPVETADRPFFFLQAHTTFGDRESSGFVVRGRGAIASGLSYGIDFPRENLSTDGRELSRRDNFLLIDAEVLHSFVWSSNDSQSCAVTDCAALFASSLADELARLGGEEVVRQINSSPTRLSAAVLIRSQDETRRFIFATGGLDQVINNRMPGHRIDRFYLSPGMEGAVRGWNPSIASLTPGMDLDTGNRAFLRAETWTDLAQDFAGFPTLETSGLSQTDFYVVNPARAVINEDNPGTVNADGSIVVTPGAAPARPKLLYADVGLDRDSTGRQVSTISATIGEVRFRYANELSGSAELGNANMVDAILDMRTVGSSRGLAAGGATLSSIHLASDFTSTASGGGNPNLDSGAPGRLGFFVLDNAGRVFDDVEDRGTLPGGTEQAVGSTEVARYAALRLGVATGSTPVEARNGVEGAVGYAVGLTERETGSGGVALGVFGEPDNRTGTIRPTNVSFSAFDNDNNTFVASINGWLLGGDGGRSAYVDDDTYGARSRDAGRDLAMVSGEMVAQGISQDLQNRTADYDHVKWGFFFGDTSTTPGQREHTHLSSYAAGRQLTGAQALTVTEAARAAAETDVRNATVTYNGHLIGTVAEGGGTVLRTVAGTYSDSFNFASRRGTVEVAFDGRTLGGSSSANEGFAQYGSLIAGGGLTGELNGHFIAPLESRPSDGGPMLMAPAGVVGAFSLTDGPTGSYRAVGTFAGE